MQGIYFYDITTLLLNTEAFHNVIDMLVERYEGRNVEAVAGMACNVAAAHAAPGSVSMARSHRKPTRYQADESRCTGFEARGFIFGPPLALRLNVPFVPLRKPGKLPGACETRQRSCTRAV